MNSIFITGGTGFVGSNFIKKIRPDRFENIFVLVRDNGKFNKLKYSLPEKTSRKLFPLYGSIEKDMFGLSKKNFDIVKNETQTIFHIAANVHHLKSYDELYESNVKSIDTAIELSQKNNATINFVSTLGAANNTNKNNKIDEDFIYGPQPHLSMGYLLSKQQAEIKLARYKDDHKINIFRLGYISSNTVTGECLYENNQFMLFIKSCIQMGCAPIIERTFNFTPVDFISEFMNIDNFSNHGGNVYNLFNYNELITWIELVNYLNRIGYNIDMVSMEEWQSNLRKSGKNNALFRLLLTYRKKDAKDNILRFGKNIKNYNYNKTKEICNKYNIYPPYLRDGYLDTIFHYLNNMEFIVPNCYKEMAI